MSDASGPRKPFASDEELSRSSILLQQISAGVSYSTLLITASYYAFHESGRKLAPYPLLWQYQAATLFTQSSTITSIYWIVLFAWSLTYLWFLLTHSRLHLTVAARIGNSWVVSNLLLASFVHAWAYSYFWLAESLLAVNFFNLSFAYFRCPTTPRVVAFGVLAGPLAWNFTALYWAGAVLFRSTRFASLCLAHLSVCGWLGYGVFYLVAYEDHALGFALSALSFSTGVGTYSSMFPGAQLQSVLAFSVGGLLFVASLAVGIPRPRRGRSLLGEDIVRREWEKASLLTNGSG